MHPCTVDELSAFYPPDSEQTKNQVAAYQSTNDLFCMHPELKKYSLQGAFASEGDYTSIMIQLASCNSVISDVFDGSQLGGEEDCEWDWNNVE